MKPLLLALTILSISAACGSDSKKNKEDENGEGGSWRSISTDWKSAELRNGGTFSIVDSTLVYCQSGLFNAPVILLFDGDGALVSEVEIESTVSSVPDEKGDLRSCAITGKQEVIAHIGGDASSGTFLARIADGKVDSSFGDNGVAKVPTTILIQSMLDAGKQDSQYYVGLTSSLVRLDEKGVHDTAFGESGFLKERGLFVFDEDNVIMARSGLLDKYDSSGTKIDKAFKTAEKFGQEQWIERSAEYVYQVSLELTSQDYIISRWQLNGEVDATYGTNGSTSIPSTGFKFSSQRFFAATNTWYMILKKDEVLTASRIDNSGTVSTKNISTTEFAKIYTTILLDESRVVVTGENASGETGWQIVGF